MNAILLAGGKSTRYGSNKALTNLSGDTMIERIITNLAGVVENIYVVGNKEADYSFLQSVELKKDIIPGKGPLGGLFTGLKYSTSRYNLLVGCDMPLLTPDYYKFLSNRVGDFDVIVPRYRGYIEPLGAIYSRDCLPVIEKSLSVNRLKIKSFFPEVRVRVIEEEEIREIGDPEKLFYNINFRSDLDDIKKYLNRD